MPVKLNVPFLLRQLAVRTLLPPIFLQLALKLLSPVTSVPLLLPTWGLRSSAVACGCPFLILQLAVIIPPPVIEMCEQVAVKLPSGSITWRDAASARAAGKRNNASRRSAPMAKRARFFMSKTFLFHLTSIHYDKLSDSMKSFVGSFLLTLPLSGVREKIASLDG